MTRSTWPALGLLHALGAGIDRDGLELVVQRKLLDQGVPQLVVVVDDQDFAAVGHRIRSPRASARRICAK